MKPYVIISPEYDHTSGGIKVMWGLYGWLLAKGQIAYINRWPQGEVIAIYPEIQNGNPVNAKQIVRYVLNTPGVMGGMDQYGRFTPGPVDFPGENVYYFSRMFGKAKDEKHYLFLPVIDTNTFRNRNGIRTKSCYLIGKGTNKHKHPEDSIAIDRRFASDQGALSDLLNECHTFYCYDNLTAMMEVSRLCGCPVQYYGDYTYEQLSQYEPGLDGITIDGVEEPFHPDLFRTHYIEMVHVFQKRLDDFIEETQG